MKTKNDLFLLFVGLSFTVLSSCVGKDTYFQYRHIQSGEWHQDSVWEFLADSAASYLECGQYDVSVELITNRGYPYRDLWLLVSHNIADTLMRTDTLHCFLADEHGRWLGHGVGSLNQLSVPYRSFIFCDSTRSHRLEIRHAMEDDLLRGVEAVGIRATGKGKVKKKDNHHR